MFKHILIPTDGSVLATAAVDRGLALAAVLGSRVTFLTVIEPYNLLTYPSERDARGDAYTEESTRAAAAILDACAEKARAKGLEAAVLTRRSIHPFVEICMAADSENVDLIAIASHGRRGVTAMLLGSQTSKVLAQSTRPVLVFR